MSGFPPTPPAIIDAVFRKDLAALRVLAARANVDERDAEGRTALHQAAADGFLGACDLLLAFGADPGAADKQHLTPLHLACANNQQQVADLLLRRGAIADARDSAGDTPLMAAVQSYRGDGTIIERLLRAGADPNLPNARGQTPRRLAMRLDGFDVGHFFLDPDAP